MLGPWLRRASRAARLASPRRTRTRKPRARPRHPAPRRWTRSTRQRTTRSRDLSGYASGDRTPLGVGRVAERLASEHVDERRRGVIRIDVAGVERSEPEPQDVRLA